MMNEDAAYLEHLQHQPDSLADLDRHEATWDGFNYPDRAWLLSGRDVWYPNPHYKGAPVPHPEMDWDEVDAPPLPVATRAWLAGWVSLYEPDEIPF